MNISSLDLQGKFPSLTYPYLVLSNGTYLANGRGQTYESMSISASQALTASYINSASIVLPLMGGDVWLNNDKSFYYNGQLYQNPGSTTAGIQEAINILPRNTGTGSVAGGTIHFGPYIYQTSNTIYITQSLNQCIHFKGPGLSAGGIVCNSPVPAVFAGKNNNYTATIFSAENMFFANTNNATCSIITLQGLSNDGALLGGVARAKFDMCWFGWWNAMTGSWRPPALTPDVGTITGAYNLLPIYANMNYSDNLTITRCQFTFCNSLSIAADHLTLTDNMFEGTGVTNTNHTDWPSSSIFYPGYAVVFQEPSTDIGFLPNGNKAWTIGGNSFVQNWVGGTPNAGGVYLFADFFTKPHVVSGDDYELNEVARISAYIGSDITFVNCTGTSPTGYNILNTSDFSVAFTLNTGSMVKNFRAREVSMNVQASSSFLSSVSTFNVSFKRAMPDNKYTIGMTLSPSTSGSTYGKTPTGFTASFATSYTGVIDWSAMYNTQ